MYTPETEGIDHINAYSKSRTELGKLLSNFAYTEFTCKDGRFASIEAYWYWLICEDHPDRDKLKLLSGFVAKREGRKLSDGDWRDDDEFKGKILRACWKKVLLSDRLKELLRESDLPIVHYYAYGNPPKINTPTRGLWIWEWYEKARAYLKDNPEL
jgi:predicted NAD-dependent protein-ADP-ribosyltransferase YbiA (DUF1768 family)